MDKTEQAKHLIHRLWTHYCQMVPAAQRFKEFFLDIGLSSAIDHIAFRTYGLSAMARVWQWFGYTEGGRLEFPSKDLSARFYLHTDPALPRIFISRYNFSGAEDEAALNRWRNATDDSRVWLIPYSGDGFASMPLERFVEFFAVSPYNTALPKSELAFLDGISEYVSWVRLFGNLPNHFTVAVHQLPGSMPFDIEQLSEKMAACDIAMTGRFEGAKGSKLRQTSTEAAEVMVPLVENGAVVYEKRKYAYMELAERKPVLFNGFLGEQAANLFDVTNAAK